MRPPIRVIHVVAGLGRGGVESWLSEVAKRIDRQHFVFDIAVHLAERPGDYTQDILATGSRVHRLPPPGRPLAFGPALYRLFRDEGGYDVVHTHVHLFNGVVLTLARLAGVPVRIAHSRNSSDSNERSKRWRAQAYRMCMRRLIDASATGRWAVSEFAGVGLFGADWRRAHDARVVRSAIDLSRFEALAEDKRDHRAMTVAHIARLDPQKNQPLVADVMIAVAGVDASTRLLLVGPRMVGSWLEHRLRRGLPDGRLDVRPAVTDTAPLLSSEIDVLLLPSFHEGLPRIALEAQAAGVPVAMSDTITPEAIVVEGLVERLSLDADVGVWRDAVIDLARRRRAGQTPTRASCVRAMRASDFDIDRNVESLQRLYLELVGGSPAV